MKFEDIYKQYYRDVYYFLLSLSGNPELSEELFSLYRPYEPDELAENMKYVTHFHTKFYHMEHGEEKTIPYDRILEIIKSSGFKGYLISEYEGHYCYDAHQYPAADQVKAHIEMEKRLLGL